MLVMVLVSVESALVSAYVLCVLIFVGVFLCMCVCCDFILHDYVFRLRDNENTSTDT